MPRHGEPDSRFWNFFNATRIVVVGIVVSVIAGVSGSFLYNYYLGGKQAVANDRRITEDKVLTDSQTPAVRVYLDQGPSDWPSWLSGDEIDIPPGETRGISNTGQPTDRQVVNTAMPFNHHSQTSQVSSRISFTLTGLHNNPVRITGIKAVIDAQRPPPAGTVYYAVPQGAGGKEDFAIDFSSPDLNARIQDEEGAPTTVHYLSKRTVTLSKGESVGFNAMMIAPFYGTDIDFHLTFSFDDKSTVNVYDSTGKPFRIVGYPFQVKRGYVTAKDGPEDPGLLNYGIYPCTWPKECRSNALREWPYEQ
ncbi:hypothetical protein [Mycobacteroides abscessus]|uniref:hypothetical protein n=1 Tax=Mycobacteroides abscessus TaxID=36809 RepID=UPI0013000C9A|nr:hypothetical protein [Mycobacteroides abscessus]